jgi:hypothetical protein
MTRTKVSPAAASSAADDAPAGSTAWAGVSEAVGKRRRGAGPRLSDLQRLEIIRRRRQIPPSSSSSSASASLVPLRGLAREFGVDEKTIRRVMAHADEIERRASRTSIAGRANSFRRPAPKFPELERQLVQWLDTRQRREAHALTRSHELTPSAVIEQAKRFAQALGIGEDQFKGSWGWYDKFCKRYGLRAVNGHSRLPGVDSCGDDAHSGAGGDAVGTGEVSLGAGDEIRSAEDLQAVIAQYDPNWVFTVDEAVLLYDYLPPLIRPADGDHGSRQRLPSMVTLVACCNSTGTMSLPVTMIGKPRWPTQAASFPLPYLQQDHSWMDRVTFAQWFDTVFCAFVRSNFLPDTIASQQKRGVLLTVDGDKPGYQAGFEQEGVRVVAIPSKHKDSSKLGRDGVDRVLVSHTDFALRDLKRQYKRFVLRDAIAFHAAPAEVQRVLTASTSHLRREEGGVHFGRPPTLLDAARSLAVAWSQVFNSASQRVSFQRIGSTPVIASSGCEEIEDSDGVADEMKRLLSDHIIAFGSRQQPAVAIPNFPQIHLPIDEVGRQVGEFLRIDNDRSPVLLQVLQRELHDQLGGGSGKIVNSTVLDTGDSGDEEQVLRQDVQSGPASDPRAALLGATQLGIYLRSVQLCQTLPGTSIRRSDGSRDSSDPEFEKELEASIQAADRLRRLLQRLDASNS